MIIMILEATRISCFSVSYIFQCTIGKLVATLAFEMEATLGPLNCGPEMMFGNKKSKIFPVLN
jgi:hypothetical protein